MADCDKYLIKRCRMQSLLRELKCLWAYNSEVICWEQWECFIVFWFIFVCLCLNLLLRSLFFQFCHRKVNNGNKSLNQRNRTQICRRRHNDHLSLTLHHCCKSMNIIFFFFHQKEHGLAFIDVPVLKKALCNSLSPEPSSSVKWHGLTRTQPCNWARLYVSWVDGYSSLIAVSSVHLYLSLSADPPIQLSALPSAAPVLRP